MNKMWFAITIGTVVILLNLLTTVVITKYMPEDLQTIFSILSGAIYGFTGMTIYINKN